LPGFTSRWRMPRAWHWAKVRRTARMKEATCFGFCYWGLGGAGA
jgi:hypothetical protein